MFKICSSLLLLFFCLFSVAQNMTVYTINIAGEPATNINVQLLKNKEVLQFLRTDASGKAVFTGVQSGAYTLKVTSMLYKTQMLEVNSNLEHAFTFQLEAQITEIKTVEIKTRPKISFIKKDTLVYNISALKDGTERTTEDLIRKLPGLEVNEYGKVTYQGRALGQVLIDKSEFFGRNHTMAIRNISADMIEGIELWKEYTTLNGNASTALNLKIKEEFKGKITGNAEAQLGFNESYASHANLFRFSKAGNFALVTDFNNLGRTPINFMDYLDMNTQENINDAEDQSIRQTPSFLNTDNKLKSKDNQFGALQYSKSGKKFSVAAFSIFNATHLKKEIFTQRLALNGQPGGLDFKEERREDNNGYLGTTQVKFKLTFGKKSFLYYNLRFNPEEDHFDQHTERFYEQNNTFKVAENTKNTDLSNFISWNTEVDQTKISFSFNQMLARQNAVLNLNAGDHLFFLNDQSRVQQYFKLDTDQYDFDFRLKNKNKFIDFNLRTGISYKEENLVLSEKVLETYGNQFLKTYAFSNALNLNKNFSQFKLAATLDAHLLQINNVNHHYFQKIFSLKYLPPLKVKTEIEFNHASRVQSPSLKTLNASPIYTRDLSFFQNESVIPGLLLKTENYQISWSRFNLNQGDFWYLAVRYEEAKPFITADVMNYGSLYGVKNKAGEKQKNWFAYGSIDKRFWKNFISKTKASAVIYKTPDFIGGIENTSEIQNFELSQLFSTRFKNSLIQFDLGYAFTRNNFSQSLYKTSSGQTDHKISLGLRTRSKKNG